MFSNGSANSNLDDEDLDSFQSHSSAFEESMITEEIPTYSSEESNSEEDKNNTVNNRISKMRHSIN
jgi:hypothetical protein